MSLSDPRSSPVPAGPVSDVWDTVLAGGVRPQRQRRAFPGPRTPALGQSHHLSLSRFNHRLPGCETHPDVVQGPAAFHHQSTDPRLPQADAGLHDAAALDTAVALRKPPPALRQRLVRSLLHQRERRAAWLLGRHEELPLRTRARQEAASLEQPTPCGPGRGRRVGNARRRHAAAVGGAQPEEQEAGMDAQALVDRVVRFLTALTGGLCRRVLGAADAPCGAVMGTRGDAAAAAGPGTTGAGASSRGTPTGAAAAAAPPAAPARARAAPGWLGSGPCRPGARAPPGGQRCAGRPAGKTGALPALARDRAGRPCTGGRGAASHRGATR